MGNLLRKGSPRPSKPFLKIRRKVRRKASARKFRETRRTGESKAQAICRSSSRFRAGRSIAESPKPSTKPPGARKFRRARRTGESKAQAICRSSSRFRGATKPCGIYEAQMKRELPEATPFGTQTQCRIARSVSLSNRWILETSSATLMVSPALAWLREETRAIIFCSPVTR